LEIALTTDAPELVHAGLLALPFTGSLSPLASRLDGLLDGGLDRLVKAREANSEPGSTAVLHRGTGSDVESTRIALIGVGDPRQVDDDGVRTAAAAAAGALRRIGGAVAWLLDPHLPLSPERQVRAAIEGALLGDYLPVRWRTSDPAVRADRLVIVGATGDMQAAAERTAVVARWTNRARELVDAPPNQITPDGLAREASALLSDHPVFVDVHPVEDSAATDLPALALVGQGSANKPRLIVLRYHLGAAQGPVLALVGKAVTFDSGGFFLKPQEDIVRQKADMGGGAAVIGAVGAIAELELPVAILAVIPAAENMLDGAAYRPSDIITTAAGTTVEITNPDAEGRLILADALWYAKKYGATHLVDIATLTGAMRGGMGDLYTGVFSNDDEWRAQLVAAGQASGDYAWPWPLHPRYRRLINSRLADLRNTAGKNFGLPIVAAAFLETFVGDTTWAHLDIQSTAYLDEQRDYLGPGATGAGVRLLTELAIRLSETTASERDT
jgi:leucyl aminopeptidase